MPNIYRLSFLTLAFAISSNTHAISTAALAETKSSAIYSRLADQQLEKSTAAQIDYTNEEIAKLGQAREKLLQLLLESPGKRLSELDSSSSERSTIESIPSAKSMLIATRSRKGGAGASDLTDAEIKQLIQTINEKTLDQQEALAELDSRNSVNLIPLHTMPGAGVVGKDGKISPTISLYSWDSGFFGKVDRDNPWHWGYGVNVDIGAGNVSEDVVDAADEFLLSGGDGTIALEGAIGYRFGEAANLSFGASINQSWLKTNIIDDETTLKIDDEVRQVAASVMLETRYFYMGVERGWNKYVGNEPSAFSESIDGRKTLKFSFLVSMGDGYYLRLDSMKGENGALNSVVLTKNLRLF